MKSILWLGLCRVDASVIIGISCFSSDPSLQHAEMFLDQSLLRESRLRCHCDQYLPISHLLHKCCLLTGRLIPSAHEWIHGTIMSTDNVPYNYCHCVYHCLSELSNVIVPPFVCPSALLFVLTSVCQSIPPSVCPSVCPAVLPSVCPNVCLSICPSVYPVSQGVQHL